MSQITEIPNTPWRDQLAPASFKGAMFHVEAGSRESGRRIVVHEFPKRERPYAEDMGRKAIEFSVRGYCISYPYNSGVRLYMRDYRLARDDLIAALETEGAGMLQLPYHVTKSAPPLMVVCPRYRMTEEEKLGGYCVFDMQFVEFGVAPGVPQIASDEKLRQQSQDARKLLEGQLKPKTPAQQTEEQAQQE